MASGAGKVLGRIRGRIIDVMPQTDRITAFRIAPAKGGALPTYEPGSHITVEVPGGETRAYSLIDFTPVTQTPRSYTIAVQREDGGRGGSRHMHGLGVGDTIVFDTPHNDFFLQDNSSAVLLAGGIGITPMISMATALAARGTPFRFHYAARSRGQMAFVDQLEARHGSALTLHCSDDPASALDLDRLIAGLDPQADLYVCGPRRMIEATRARAEAAGIARRRIHFELFSTVGPQEGDSPFEVALASTGARYTVPADQTILETLEAAGVDLTYDCKRGDCGICQCGVLEGVPDHRDVVLTEDERAAGRVMQICVSRSKTPRLVLDI